MGFDEVQWAAELRKNLSAYASPNIEEELIVQYEVMDSNGNVESFHCTLGTTAEVFSRPAESPDVIFSLDKEIAISIHKGELTTEEAFLKGLLRMNGDVERLVEAFPSFTQ